MFTGCSAKFSHRVVFDVVPAPRSCAANPRLPQAVWPSSSLGPGVIAFDFIHAVGAVLVEDQDTLGPEDALPDRVRCAQRVPRWTPKTGH